jgi:hypothetical protein
LGLENVFRRSSTIDAMNVNLTFTPKAALFIAMGICELLLD